MVFLFLHFDYACMLLFFIFSQQSMLVFIGVNDVCIYSVLNQFSPTNTAYNNGRIFIYYIWH